MNQRTTILGILFQGGEIGRLGWVLNPTKVAMAPPAKKLTLAKEGVHFRYRLGNQANHVFKCITGHAPRGFSSFKSFVSHLSVRHGRKLPADFFEPGSPWLCSKPDLDRPAKKPKKCSSGKKTEAASWIRLRSTARLRWQMSKQRKKNQLKEDYCVPTLGKSEPPVKSKSCLIRLIKVFHIRANVKNGWGCLVDDNFFEMLEEHVTSAPITSVVYQWAEHIRKLPVQLPVDRKLAALQVDCLGLQYIFPKVSGSTQLRQQRAGQEVREALVADALDFLRKKRESLLWKVAPKEVNFEHAYPDYVKWKKEQKHLSVAIATQNCVDDYKADGMSQQQAEIAV